MCEWASPHPPKEQPCWELIFGAGKCERPTVNLVHHVRIMSCRNLCAALKTYLVTEKHKGAAKPELNFATECQWEKVRNLLIKQPPTLETDFSQEYTPKKANIDLCGHVVSSNRALGE